MYGRGREKGRDSANSLGTGKFTSRFSLIHVFHLMPSKVRRAPTERKMTRQLTHGRSEGAGRRGSTEMDRSRLDCSSAGVSASSHTHYLLSTNTHRVALLSELLPVGFREVSTCQPASRNRTREFFFCYFVGACGGTRELSGCCWVLHCYTPLFLFYIRTSFHPRTRSDVATRATSRNY